MLQPLKKLQRHLCQTIRLVATDMDGTLTQTGQFTAELLATLVELQQAGIEVVIVTGRSAGWVQGVVNYLPIAGAIAENGGLFFNRGWDQTVGKPEVLVALPGGANPDWLDHRQQLATLFAQLQAEFPQIQPAADNLFRLTDWTFDVQGLSPLELQQMSDRCRAQNWGFTYSTVQCHIKPLNQDKAAGLQTVLHQHFPQISPTQLVTVGDSPNDESLFDGDRFPLSVGVANLLDYRDRLTHQPTYVTQASEVAGFRELVEYLLSDTAKGAER
jgi:hypothetical protein